MIITGAETYHEIWQIEQTAGPDGLDRFGRSREVLRAYAEHARNAATLEDFFFWWDKFITYSSEVRNPSVTHKQHDDAILLAGFGLAGEGGEVADVIKKVYFHDHGDRDTMKPERLAKLREEWGDRFWYDGQLARNLAPGASIIDVLRGVIQGNMDKLTDDPRKV